LSSLRRIPGLPSQKRRMAKPHQVAETIKIPEEKAEIIAQFLQKYAFITYNPKKKRVKIDPRVKEIYQEDAKENLQGSPQGWE